MRFKRDRNSLPLDILIFDMDGVLIDVTKSYRETIQQTVHLYFKTCLGFEEGKGRVVTKKDISLFKSAGGFNNDWDLTSALLLYLLSLSDVPPFPKRKSWASVMEVVSYLQKKSFGLRKKMDTLIQKKHLPALIKRVKLLGGGLSGIRHAIGNSWDGWVYRLGDLDQKNVVKRIFQEIYLGKKFSSYYHLSPRFYKGPGYYLREKILFPKEILATLHKKCRMGIASGRPRFEAELALTRFRLLPYFDSVITLDECEEEEARIFQDTCKKVKRSKPHPFSLIRAIQEIGIPHPRCGYVGDVVDDILTARSAKKKWNILAIGFLRNRKNHKTMKTSFLKAGADLVIESPKELLQLIA